MAAAVAGGSSTIQDSKDDDNRAHFTAVNGRASPGVAAKLNGSSPRPSPAQRPQTSAEHNSGERPSDSILSPPGVASRPAGPSGSAQELDSPQKRSYDQAFDSRPKPVATARMDGYQQPPLPPGSLDERDRARYVSDYPPPPSHTTSPYYTEAAPNDGTETRLVEALRTDARPSRPSYGSPDDQEADDDDPGDLSSMQRTPTGMYAEGGMTKSGVQLTGDGKRRKRVFSNRTKTGCMTCRKRKKKCDEQHPECNNCMRGGFVCEGYPSKSSWQKPTETKPPLLQSRDPQYPPPPPMPPHPADDRGVQRLPPAPRAEAPHGYEQARHEPPRREIRSMGEAPHPARTSPPNAPPYGDPGYGNAYVYPPHRPKLETSGVPSRQAQRDPGLSRESRSSESHYPHMRETPANADVYVSPPLSTNSYTNGSPFHRYSSNYGPARDPAELAKMALEDTESARGKGAREQHEAQQRAYQMSLMTNRERMLSGEYFSPYTPTLIADREQCTAAVWRFINASNPSTGNGPEQRSSFLRSILSLKPTPEQSYPTKRGELDHRWIPQPPSGSIGINSIVESPFHCDYGYNIRIGDNVVIGANCRITDLCSVTIGNRCVLSPNVTLMTATYNLDPLEREKGLGMCMARFIIIEDGCWIGPGATIMPGVRIGRGSTIGAGSVVAKDVVPDSVMAGVPAKLIKMVYNEYNQ